MPRGLSRSALIVLGHLSKNGPMTPKDIGIQAGLAPRTVSFALRKLIKKGLCRKVPNLIDMRKPLYYTDIKRIEEFISKAGFPSEAGLHAWISSIHHGSRSFNR